MRIGLALPHYDFSFWDGRPADLDSVVQIARRAEALGYDSVWVSDHFFLDLAKYGGTPRRHGSLEALTTLGALAAETARVRLGTLVLCEAFRPPALLAKAAATLDVISGGRLDLGLGAGWYEAEYEAAGIPFLPPGVRLERLREAAIVVGGMLERSPFSFEGAYYRVAEAPNEPQPIQRPRPPIWIGGKGGPRLLRVVAETADGWNLSWGTTPVAYAERLGALARACERVSRDPATVRRTIGFPILVGTDERDLAARAEALVRWAPAGPTPQEYAETGLVGTPERIVERLAEFERLGVEEAILTLANLPFAVYAEDALAMVAETVLPLVRAL